jgi:peroxiredoxin
MKAIISGAIVSCRSAAFRRSPSGHYDGLRLSMALLWLVTSLAVAGARPAAAPFEASAQGVIETGVGEFQLELFGLEGKLTVSGKDGKATVPRGHYIVSRWSMARRDRQGRVWEATFNPDVHPWFEVGPEPARLEMTDKLTAVTTAELRGSTGLITLRFQGGSGWLQTLTVDGVRVPGPTVRVLDGSDHAVAELPTHYACCLTCRATWSTPADLRGTFRIVPQAGFGPFALATVQTASLTLTDATAAAPALVAAKIGQEAPDFSLPRIDGTTPLRPFWLRGRPLVLLFSCGCAPCEEVARRLAATPELAKRIQTAVVVTNRSVANAESVQQFRERTGYRGPMLADDGAVGTAYGAIHCPKLWLLDSAGVARWSGGGEGDTRVPAALVDGLLKALPGPAAGGAAQATGAP